MKAEFVSKVDGGKLHTEVAANICRVLRLADGKRVKIVITEAKRRPSNNQQRYYHGLVVPMVMEMFKEAGNVVNADEVHTYLKAYVGKLTATVDLPNGSKAVVLRSTTDLSKAEFENYMTQCRVWAAEMGCQIPEPNEEMN